MNRLDSHCLSRIRSRSMGARFAFVLAITLFASSSQAQTVGTLTLDSLSFISFQNQEVLLLPSGSTVQFQFGTPNSDGSIPFSISPSGLSVAPINLPSGGGTLAYGLASVANGIIRPATDGHIIQFTANVAATLNSPGGNSGTFTYAMPFTTETASATDVLGQITVERTGVRLIEGVWYAQIVGATTNRENAFPAPGTAVYSVLSGQFDQLPIGQ